MVELTPSDGDGVNRMARAVACPKCKNGNREAKRKCKNKKGPCDGKGYVVKYIPVTDPVAKI